MIVCRNKLASLRAKAVLISPSASIPSLMVVEQIRNTASASYGIQAATAAVQGLAGGNMAQALTGAAAPYLAEVIKKSTGNNQVANTMAHAVLGAVTACASGSSALAGAAGAASAELMAPAIIAAMGWDKNNLNEDQKQTVSALATLAAGLAGGLTGNSTADTVAGAQVGKNALENIYGR
ncbi:VENN motif pre-toxin domain-containing protein [Yersinia enterocolitica]